MFIFIFPANKCVSSADDTCTTVDADKLNSPQRVPPCKHSIRIVISRLHWEIASFPIVVTMLHFPSRPSTTVHQKRQIGNTQTTARQNINGNIECAKPSTNFATMANRPCPCCSCHHVRCCHSWHWHKSEANAKTTMTRQRQTYQWRLIDVVMKIYMLWRLLTRPTCDVKAIVNNLL